MNQSTESREVQAWLEGLLGEHGAIAGTVHRLEGEQLVLAASVNIPPPVVAVTKTIPRGKGMAGLAWDRGVPVQTCNLQTDETGDVRPGAKAVNAQAAVAVPVFAPTGELRAVVGFAFAHERELGPEEMRTYEAAAAQLPV